MLGGVLLLRLAECERKKSIREGENGWRMRTAPELTVLPAPLAHMSPSHMGLVSILLLLLLLIYYYYCY